ncbi:hypothetical protein F511_35051 [Dorcoceras hygrometricum]|uniref:Uncharacterized protein n=1 Tax=Dorcoceras hygrometricum TaxID=472368 RepID=A0A2Z7AF49_9LAMI|nr:hypothetical protein F511_35051 [Dorcoceras hygrometricum]
MYYSIVFVLCSGLIPANIRANINSIPLLNGSNFKSWQENLLIVLGVMDLDLAIRVDCPPTPTDKSTSDEKKEFERWERSNRMYLMIMKKAIPETFRGTMSSDITTAKKFLKNIEKRFAKSEKTEIGTLLTNLISMWYKGKGNIREYIMEMSHLASRLKALKLELSEDLLVHLVLISLPTQFNQFKVQRRRSAAAISVQQMVRNISISSWFDAFKESAVELAMETSRVTSAVRNQLEHDNPAETYTS